MRPADRSCPCLPGQTECAAAAAAAVALHTAAGNAGQPLLVMEQEAPQQGCLPQAASPAAHAPPAAPERASGARVAPVPPPTGVPSPRRCCRWQAAAAAPAGAAARLHCLAPPQRWLRHTAAAAVCSCLPPAARYPPRSPYSASPCRISQPGMQGLRAQQLRDLASSPRHAGCCVHAAREMGATPVATSRPWSPPHRHAGRQPKRHSRVACARAAGQIPMLAQRLRPAAAAAGLAAAAPRLAPALLLRLQHRLMLRAF